MKAKPAAKTPAPVAKKTAARATGKMPPALAKYWQKKGGK
jgi:hypothetical protein